MITFGNCNSCARSTKASHLRGRHMGATDVVHPVYPWNGAAGLGEGVGTGVKVGIGLAVGVLLVGGVVGYLRSR